MGSGSAAQNQPLPARSAENGGDRSSGLFPGLFVFVAIFLSSFLLSSRWQWAKPSTHPPRGCSPWPEPTRGIIRCGMRGRPPATTSGVGTARPYLAPNRGECVRSDSGRTRRATHACPSRWAPAARRSLEPRRRRSPARSCEIPEAQNPHPNAAARVQAITTALTTFSDV